ncbi:MAG: hypothetical protein QOI58_1188 [Thermoanaerobaculia bacterium]|nr:hypothetical protein [Thermoanaerobaculia bacterium]
MLSYFFLVSGFLIALLQSPPSNPESDDCNRGYRLHEKLKYSVRFALRKVRVLRTTSFVDCHSKEECPNGLKPLPLPLTAPPNSVIT